MIDDSLSIFAIIVGNVALVLIAFFIFRYLLKGFRYRPSPFREKEDSERSRYEMLKLIDLVQSLKSFQARWEESLERQPYELRHTVASLESLRHELRIMLAEMTTTLSKLSAPTKSTGVPSHEKVLSIYQQVSSEFSHSIKTPLASIESAISNLNEHLPDMLQGQQEMDDKTSSLLLSFLENATISLDHIKDILRRGAGFFPGEAERISVPVFVHKAIRMAKEVTKSKTEVAISLDGVPEIKYYSLNLLISLIQILVNAFEATESSGSIQVTGRYEKTTGVVQVDISNTGSPIPVDDQPKLFQESFSTKESGRGSGLLIARHCLQIVGGDIKLVESTDSVTTFRISFKTQDKT
jgi:signal transduction histidine kinase